MPNRKWGALAIVAAWAVSIVLPVALLDRAADAVVRGWHMLGFGWMGVVLLQIGWWANLTIPVIAFAFWWWERPRRRWMAALGVSTLLLALNALFWHQLPDDASAGEVVRYLPGYWLWLAAALGAGGWATAYATADTRRTPVA